MKVDFQNIEEGQNGKLFATLEEEQLPVGQLFYKVDHDNKNLIVDYIYIPRKYWREGGIREQLIAELQSMHPSYSFSMKENQKQAHLLKEAPARSKAQFRYMQGICNGSIEPPKGMTRAQACEYVEGQKDYKKLPEKRTSYISNRREKLRIPFHKNIYTGEPCRCGFHIPEQKQSGWKQIVASKLDKIIKDDPKVLRTEEGQKVLEWMKYLPEKVDDLLPWIVREYKKKRLIPSISDDGIFRGMEIQGGDPEDGIRRINEETLSHWADWFNSNSPTRRGVDIMQLTTEQMLEKIQEWDLEFAQKMNEAESTEDEKGIIYKYPDGWTMRELDPQDCTAEGEQMGHCVGTGSYGRGIEQGNIKILSLRDEKNKPHATLEVKSDGSVEQIQGKQNVHPIAPYRKRIRQFMIDPDGFEKTFGRKPTFPGDSRVSEWGEFRGMGDTPNYDPQMLEIDEEEEFNPQYDENIRQHPYAGQGGYSRNYRPEHYGIYPPEASPDKPVDMARLLGSLPEDISQEDLQKLLDYARRTGQVNELATIMTRRVWDQKGKALLIVPSFNDESRNGWRDIFEKMTQTQSNDPNYQEKWNEWVSSIWSEDPRQLAKNLVEINKYKGMVRVGEEDEIEQNILEIINEYNSINQLRSMFNEEIDELTSWPDFEKADFSDYRGRFEKGLNQGEGLTQLPTKVDEKQLSLLSKWKKKSNDEEHSQEEAKWEGQAAAAYNLPIVYSFKNSLSSSDYVPDSLHYLLTTASQTQDFYYNFMDESSSNLIDTFVGTEEAWVLDDEYQDSFWEGFYEETQKDWEDYIEQLNIDIKKALEKESIEEAIIKDWPWQSDQAVPRFKKLIEKFENMGPLSFLGVIDNYYYEIYGEAKYLAGQAVNSQTTKSNFAWVKNELDNQIYNVINNAEEIIAKGLGKSNPDYSADMSKWYAQPVSPSEEAYLGPAKTDENEARKHRKEIRDKWNIQPGKKLQWTTEEDFPKKRWE
jgi:hypothetical protein